MPISRVVAALSVVLSIAFGWHYYLWTRLVRDASLPEPWGRIATIAIAVLGAAIPVSFLMMRVAPRALSSPLLWISYTWLGLAFFLLVVLVPLDLSRALGSIVAPPDPARRVALARLVSGATGLLGFGLAGTAMAATFAKVAVQHVRVPLAKLPASLSGYTIVQLSDVHIGPTLGREFVEQIVATANAQGADAIAITGDLVDGSVEDLGHLVEPLRHLRAKDGVYFVTGNHEYYSGVDAWLAHLGKLGIRVLRNERLPLRDGLDLAGVDDSSARRFGGDHGQDVEKALAGRDLSRAVVLLAHQPKAILDPAAAGIDLQLSGHTHGGQIWPFGYLVKLDQPHVAGLRDHGSAKIYVSRGTGYWGPPMRLGSPAEVTRIELVAGA